MYDFAYHRPKSVADAIALLKGNEEARPMSGGMTLIPTLKQRLARPSDVVDLGGLKELAGVKIEGDTLVIGGMTKHGDVATSADVKKVIPALADLAGHIGDPQVRNRGTMGGSMANADPAADYPSAILGLGATVVTNLRQIAGDDRLGMAGAVGVDVVDGGVDAVDDSQRDVQGQELRAQLRFGRLPVDGDAGPFQRGHQAGACGVGDGAVAEAWVYIDGTEST
jgi:hypothetical protein